MSDSWRCQDWRFKLTSSFILVGMILSFKNNCAFAQNITLDGSLGTAETLPGPKYIIEQESGQSAGTNLFHSFSEFNLNTGELAYFRSNSDIRNILSRVTGGFPSLIDGSILTESSHVNLFLINPNGIIFGPNASIDVGSATRGSFIATTVDALVWANGGQFSATNLGNPDGLLTLVGDPSGFLASLRPPQPIMSSESLLATYPGQSLLLLGGEVVLNGSFLSTPGGRIELGGVAAPGIVELNVNGNELSLSFPNNLARADVSITDSPNYLAFIDVSAEDGGSIAINARNLNILGESVLLAGIGQNLGSADSQAGDITLNATETLTISNSYIVNFVDTGAVGDGGNIHIQARAFSAEGSVLEASTYGEGNAGSVLVQAEDFVRFSDSAIFSNVEATAIGNRGGINIQAGSFSAEGSLLEASTYGQGNSGSVFVQVDNSVSLASSGIFSNVEATAVGDGGGIHIQAGSLSAEGSLLEASTYGEGNAGSVFVQAEDFVRFSDSAIFSNVEATAVGDGEGIHIQARSLSAEGSVLSASTAGQGNAGSIFLQAEDAVSMTRNSAIFTTIETGGVGDSGGINIEAGSVSFTDGVQLQSIVRAGGRGDAGDVNINARDGVTMIGGGRPRTAIFTGVDFTRNNLRAIGNGGEINIQASFLYLDGAAIGSDTHGSGKAGDVNIAATEFVLLTNNDFDSLTNSSSRIGSSTTDGAIGNGGDIRIETSSLSLLNGSYLNASTTTSEGNGGNIWVSAETFEATNGGQIVTNTGSGGRAGNIDLDIAGSLTLSGSDSEYTERQQQLNFDPDKVAPGGAASGVFARTEGSGSAGDVQLTTTQLSVREGAAVSTSTSGAGRGGQLRVRASESVELTGVSADGQLISSLSTETSGTGNAGNLWIETGQLRVQDGAKASAATMGTGEGGGLTVNATDFVQLSGGGGLFTETSDAGNAGSLMMTTPQLNLEDGALISASTSGTGKGGSLTVYASESVQLRNRSGLLAQSAGRGDAGNLEIVTGEFVAQDQAQVTVSSQGSRTAGNLQLSADSVFLDNEAKLQAETASGNGGNITLRVRDILLMRDNSLISTTAGTAGAGGDGGNLDLSAQFIIAVPSENSDITANAFEGRGGNINVVTEGIFGTQFRPRLTPKSDITASSQFGVDGSVQITTPGIDPSRGLTNLPADLGDAENQMAQSCAPGSAEASEQSQFTITGRGGLPSSPMDVLSNDAIQVDWVALKPGGENANSAVSGNATRPKPTPVVEAEGWVVNEKGQIVLVAASTPSHRSWQTATPCHKS